METILERMPGLKPLQVLFLAFTGHLFNYICDVIDLHYSMF